MDKKIYLTPKLTEFGDAKSLTENTELNVLKMANSAISNVPNLFSSFGGF